MKYALIESGVITQISTTARNGFIKVDDKVCAGMIEDGIGGHKNPPESFSDQAQSAQSEMIGELNWVDIQLKYHSTNDVKRAASTVELLNAYAIECRDYVHDTADGLVIVGDKPVRPK